MIINQFLGLMLIKRRETKKFIYLKNERSRIKKIITWRIKRKRKNWTWKKWTGKRKIKIRCAKLK